MNRSLALLCATLAGCGGSTSGPSDGGTNDAAGEASAPSDSGGLDTSSPVDGGGGDAPAACNAIVNVGSPVTQMQVAQAPPAPIGGTLVDGTYALTDATRFTGPGGATGPVGAPLRETIQIAGSTVQLVDDTGPMTSRKTVTVTTNGTMLTGMDTCPDQNVVHETYAVAAPGIVVYLPGMGYTLGLTFTKQ